MTDHHITCPYCGAVSYVYTSMDRDGKGWLSHHCTRCGRREMALSAAVMGWARYEAIRTDSGVDVELLEADDRGVYYGTLSHRCAGEWGE
jgi:transcription elongation factor Elf1